MCYVRDPLRDRPMADEDSPKDRQENELQALQAIYSDDCKDLREDDDNMVLEPCLCRLRLKTYLFPFVGRMAASRDTATSDSTAEHGRSWHCLYRVVSMGQNDCRLSQ